MSEQTTSTREAQKEKKVPCEVYSRIVGYLRPVQNWNKGKKQEFHDRKLYRSQVDTADKEA